MPEAGLVILGIRGVKQISAFIKAQGAPLPNFKQYYWGDWVAEDHGFPNLTNVHLTVANEFWPSKLGPQFIQADTGLGMRELIPLSWEIVYDPDECGHEPSDAVFGVGLTSRYFPTLLDWRSKHGGLESLTLNSETIHMIERVKEEIVKIFPAAIEFEPLFTSQHY